MQLSDFKMATKPNCSLSVTGQKRLFLLVSVFALTVATGFSMIGAWMVLPFAGLELLVLASALYHVNAGMNDYESIVICGDVVRVETRRRNALEQEEFNRYWVQVVFGQVSGENYRLVLRSHGKELELGRFMGSEQKMALAKELKRHIAGAAYR